MKYGILLICLFTTIGLHAQLQYADASAGYKVVKEKFSPPIRDVIDHYEGKTATPFMAKDHTGSELYLGNMQRPVILWFWDPQQAGVESMLDMMNRIHAEFTARGLKIVSFSTQSRQALEQYITSHPVQYSVIPNAMILGEQMYAGSLGFPRMFFLDRSGVIRRVLPAEYFQNTSDPEGLVRESLRAILSGE